MPNYTIDTNYDPILSLTFQDQNMEYLFELYDDNSIYIENKGGLDWSSESKLVNNFIQWDIQADWITNKAKQFFEKVLELKAFL